MQIVADNGIVFFYPFYTVEFGYFILKQIMHLFRRMKHNCLDELIEIESLKMTSEIFNQIKAEYERIYSTTYEHNHIFLDLNKYLKPV